MLTGPPGAGKSTIAALLGEQFEPSALVVGDAFFAFLATGAIEPWLRDANRQNEVVVQAAAAATGEFVAGGYVTVYDGVLGPWFVPQFLDAANVPEMQYAVLLPLEETCLSRVATRTEHGFTDEPATRKMHHEFASHTVDQRHVLSTDGWSAEETLEALFERLRDGRLLLDRRAFSPG